MATAVKAEAAKGWEGTMAAGEAVRKEVVAMDADAMVVEAKEAGDEEAAMRAAARAAWVVGSRPGSNRCNRSREPTTRRNRERAARRCTSGSCRLGGKARGAGTYWMCTV